MCRQKPPISPSALLFSSDFYGRKIVDINVDMIFKIAAIGIIVAVLNQVLIRAGREDQAMMTTLAGIIVFIFNIITIISDILSKVKKMVIM